MPLALIVLKAIGDRYAMVTPYQRRCYHAFDSHPQTNNMISSLVANLSSETRAPSMTLQEIASHEYVEVGQLIENRLLPLTIDADSKREMDQTTRWIQDIEGVAFVDVVFVHFEEDSENGLKQIKETNEPE